MKERKKNYKVCFVCSLVCEFKGEFVRSLELFESQYKNSLEIIFVFPKDAENLGFMLEFKEKHKVFFVDNPPKNKIKKTLSYMCSLVFNVTGKLRKQLEDIIMRENVDIIHAHFEEYDFVCNEIAREYGKKCFIHFHDALIDAYSMVTNPIIRKIKQKLCYLKYKKISKYSKIIAVSTYSFNQLKNTFKFLNSNNLLLAQNGIDFNYIGKYDYEIHDPFTFGSIVTRKEKGIEQILEACSILNSSKEKYKIKLICTDKTKQVIIENYSKLLESGVIEILEPVEDINNLFKDIDCFISASFFETFSYAIAEALAYGFPCIISDIPSTKWAEASNNVQVYKLFNSEELSEKMLFILKNGIDKSKCRRAREFILKSYSVDKTCKDLSNIYLEEN